MNENERRFEEMLMDTLGAQIDVQLDPDPDGEELMPVNEIERFADAGVMTNNAGIVVTLNDGTTYQLTIVEVR
jgi:hypothetical protein